MIIIDLSLLRLASETKTYFSAEDAVGFDRIRVAGDAERRPHPSYLRIKVTGIDPQLYLPVFDLPRDEEQCVFTLRLKVSQQEPRDVSSGIRRRDSASQP